MSEEKTAQLIISSDSSRGRKLKEIEGSGLTYIPAQDEMSKPVVARQATIALLKEELREMGLIIEDVPTIQRVANKFANELCKKPGGKLAMDYDFGLGLCEILS